MVEYVKHTLVPGRVVGPYSNGYKKGFRGDQMWEVWLGRVVKRHDHVLRATSSSALTPLSYDQTKSKKPPKSTKARKRKHDSEEEESEDSSDDRGGRAEEEMNALRKRLKALKLVQIRLETKQVYKKE